MALKLTDIVSGTPLRNVHTGDKAQITNVDQKSQRANLDWNQAVGHPRRVGWTFNALSEHWKLDETRTSPTHDRPEDAATQGDSQ